MRVRMVGVSRRCLVDLAAEQVEAGISVLLPQCRAKRRRLARLRSLERFRAPERDVYEGHAGAAPLDRQIGCQILWTKSHRLQQLLAISLPDCELRYGLVHPDKAQLFTLEEQVYRYGADSQFQINGKHISATNDPFIHQGKRCSDGRMSGERQFGLGSEDPHFADSLDIRRRRYERGFRVIHLTGNCLHFTIGEAGGVR